MTAPAPTRADALERPDPALIAACVHCGFCLPSCPTYALWGEEMDSPRGRIYLMKAAVENRLPRTDRVVRHFDACLGCLGCVTACPSGVQYGPLIEATRAQVEREHTRPAGDRFFRSAIFAIVPFPSRMRLVLVPAVLYRLVRPLLRRTGILDRLPGRLRALAELAPPVTAHGLFSAVAERTPAAGSRRMTVGLLTGCVQRLVFGEVNAATVRVLSAIGCDVVAPRSQGCCGALGLHAGRLEEARAFAKRTIETFERAGVERVVVNAAGCGSSMKEYERLLAHEPEWAGRAAAFSPRVRDVTEIVDELGLPADRLRPIPLRVAYHDACHLAHGQGVRRQPRDILRAIPGVELVPFEEPELCCGSAGIYNLVQPDPARDLGDRKARNLLAASPDIVATANPGCTLQIAAAAERLGRPLDVRHPIELVDASLRGVPPARTA